MEQMTREQQIKNWCVHFNGIQNKACKIGIAYDTFKNEQGSVMPLPCLANQDATERCDKVQFPTDEEVQARIEKSDQHLKEFLEQLNQGNCPYCKKPVEKRQVGRCVYGSCGHRLYQGRLK